MPANGMELKKKLFLGEIFNIKNWHCHTKFACYIVCFLIFLFKIFSECKKSAFYKTYILQMSSCQVNAITYMTNKHSVPHLEQAHSHFVQR